MLTQNIYTYTVKNQKLSYHITILTIHTCITTAAYTVYKTFIQAYYRN